MLFVLPDKAEIAFLPTVCPRFLRKYGRDCRNTDLDHAVIRFVGCEILHPHTGCSKNAGKGVIVPPSPSIDLIGDRNHKRQKSDVVSFKATLVFSYILTMLTNVLPGAQWIRDTGT